MPILIELGPIKITADDPDDVMNILCDLASPLTNQEAADLCGIEERSLRHRRQVGYFGRTQGRLTKADVLKAILEG
ncbi:MAG: hypothetical protein V3W44_08680 [Dehalococcoidales bacterium]